MKIINYPERKAWKDLLQRPSLDNAAAMKAVQTIIEEVKRNGDGALLELAQRFDGVTIEDIGVTEEEINANSSLLDEGLKSAIEKAAKNIDTFHKSQLSKVEVIETMPGVQCWRKNVGIEKVGLYIPGGTAPLFSTVLMLGIPAKLAGCKEIILCTPADKNGNIHPAILYTAAVVGIHKIYKVGGAQAIAAMAFGTQTIPAVHKIFGPGNQYVTAAKQLVQVEGVAIDMPAGPSEVCVLADATAHPAFVASDLLAQAEHGGDSHVLLVSTDASLVQKVMDELELQLKVLPRKNIIEKSLQKSKAIVVRTITEAIELVNEYAGEHLIISCANAGEIADEISNAGSVFIGNYSPESVGDYASGTNHTLPTNGFARAYSGVSVDSFVKKITYQKLTQEGLKEIGDTVISMAEAEGLQAHANAVRQRVRTIC